MASADATIPIAGNLRHATPRSPWIVVRRMGRPMTTDVSVQIAATPEQAAAASRAADACMAWLDEVDHRLSRFNPESELSRLNAAEDRWFAASALLFEAVAVALHAAQSSGGLFDPTLLRQIEALGYDRDFAQIAHREVSGRESAPLAPDPPASLAGWRDIELDHRRRRIRQRNGARIDLGGIAKGWAADVALSRFCEDFPGALINVGGDLRLRGGPEPGVAWSVGIRDPRDEAAYTDSDTPTRTVATVTLSRGGMATSGALRRWWLQGGLRQHHLLDPRTGRPIALWVDDCGTRQESSYHPERDGRRLLATATALAPTAARAEVAAKVALLRGYPEALRRVEAAWERYGAIGPADDTDADAGVALVLTFGSGEVAMSYNVAAYLDSWGTHGAPLPLSVPSPAPTLARSLASRIGRRIGGSIVARHPSSINWES